MEKQTNDYELVKHTLAFISENWRDQPSLDTLAGQAGLSATHLQRLFTRWAGLSPKAFLQAVTLDHARGLLRDSTSILDASYELGLSGPGRLHDLFVTHEGMSPGIYKLRGRGLTITYGFHDCPFGRALILVTNEGLAGLAFADEGQEKSALADMTSRWPEATYTENPAVITAVTQSAFLNRKAGIRTSRSRLFSSARILKSGYGKRCCAFPLARPRPIPISPPIWASHRRRGRLERRWGKIPYPSLFPATGCWENPADSAAITGASPASAPFWDGKPALWPRELFVEQRRVVQPALGCHGVIRNIANKRETKIAVEFFH